MKDIEQALTQEYSNASEQLMFSDKSKLRRLYKQPEHSKIGQKIVLKTTAVIAAAAILLTGSTALALTHTEQLADIRSFMTQHLGRLNVSNDKVDEMAERYEYIRTDSDTLSGILDSSEVNSFGEIINDGDCVIYCDLFRVYSEAPCCPIGYVYRYDLGILENIWLTPEEQNFLTSTHDPYYKNMIYPNPDGYRRNWIYVYDKEGIEVIGKCDVYHHFCTNKQLEDSENAALYRDGEYDFYYETFASDRSEHKKASGNSFQTPKLQFETPDLPTKGFDKFSKCCQMDIPLSEDATAVSSDPEMFEPDEVVCIGEKSDEPHSWVYGTFHKTGSCTVTITDGNTEYEFECTLKIGKFSYEVYSNRIK